MSEYQYYEFAAIDGPVTEADAPYVYSVSSRAEITPRRWRNVYNFGDFRGSPIRMMEHYDAHVYVTNGGTFQFMLAFPENLLPPAQLAPYLAEDWLELYGDPGRTILCWHRETEEPDDAWLEGGGLLDCLLPIRDELLHGDYRALYLGWLARQSWWGNVDEDGDDEIRLKQEPPVPPGLGELSDAQEELVDRLHVDPDLLTAAALFEVPESDRQEQLEQALGKLSRGDMRDYLLRVAEGQGARVSAELNRLVPPPLDVDSGRRRRMCEMRDLANGIREERLRRQAEERDRERRKHEAERKAHLESLIARADEVWREAEAMAELKKASAYDQAAARIKDLRDAYALAGRSAEFRRRLETFRQGYARRPALLRRLSDLSPTDGALSQDDDRLG